MTTPGTAPHRLAAGYVLAACLFALIVLAWLRGAGRFILPLLLLVGVGAIVVRIVRAIGKPLP